MTLHKQNDKKQVGQTLQLAVQTYSFFIHQFVLLERQPRGAIYIHDASTSRAIANKIHYRPENEPDTVATAQRNQTLPQDRISLSIPSRSARKLSDGAQTAKSAHIKLPRQSNDLNTKSINNNVDGDDYDAAVRSNVQECGKRIRSARARVVHICLPREWLKNQHTTQRI